MKIIKTKLKKKNNKALQLLDMHHGKLSFHSSQIDALVSEAHNYDCLKNKDEDPTKYEGVKNWDDLQSLEKEVNISFGDSPHMFQREGPTMD